jgi:hypothetical protein
MGEGVFTKRPKGLRRLDIHPMKIVLGVTPSAGIRICSGAPVSIPERVSTVRTVTILTIRSVTTFETTASLGLPIWTLGHAYA